ncbi:hypothetical protein MAUB1S_03591 [Mycolicibacterium aubagnense]
MAKDGCAGLDAGTGFDLRGQLICDPAEPRTAKGVQPALGMRGLHVLGNKPFGHHYQWRPAAGMCSLGPLDNLLDTDLLLGDEDGVGTGRHAGVQRDPARVTAHHLGDHAAVMRLAGSAQPVDRFRRNLHGGVETECVVRGIEVVVHRLRHAHDLQTGVAQPLGCGQRALAADGDDRVDAQPIQVCLDDLGPTTVFERVGA